MISFPRTDLFGVGYSDQDFDLPDRQELGGRRPNGEAYGVDYGSALWMASWTTEPLLNARAVAFETDLKTLRGVVHTFEAIDLRRPAPLTGAANDGVLASVGSDNKSLSLSGLAAGQTLSKGDYLSFDYGVNRALHRLEEDVVANGSGITAVFPVQPFLRPGWTVGAAVNLRAPRGVFKLLPGTDAVQRRMTMGKFTTVSFRAVQHLERNPG